MISRIREAKDHFMKKLDSSDFTARELLLTGGVLFLLGVIIGIFISPKNMTVGCYNGTNVYDGNSEKYTGLNGENENLND